MRYKIIYDKPGRLRVRTGRYTFSTEQGYGIEKLIMSSPVAISAEATPANGGILICYKPNCREQILSLIDHLDSQNLPVSTVLDVNYRRELDDALVRSLAYMICRFYVMKFFLPTPVRILFTIRNALRYWKKGLGALKNKQLNVDVLDAASIFASVLQGNFKTASSIMALLKISELLEDYTKKRARQSLTEGLALHIDNVWLVQGEEKELAPVSQIQV